MHQALTPYLSRMAQVGVAHVIVNVSGGARPVHSVLKEIGDRVIPAIGLHK